MKYLILLALLGSVLGYRIALADDLIVGGVSSPSPGLLEEFWQNEKVSLALRTDYFQNSKTLNGEQNLWGQTAQLNAYPYLDPSFDGKVNAWVTDSNPFNNDVAVFKLIEGYMTWHLGDLDLRLGKQIVGWGRADGINPTDNVTPHDLTVQLPFDEDKRFGTWALKLDLYLNKELDLTLFTTPFFEPTVFPLPKGLGFNFNSNPPAQTLEHSEFAARLNKTGGDWDWSVSYFRGYRLLPDINNGGGSAGNVTLNLLYSQIDVVGADFAHNVGPFGLRGEAAYVHPTSTDSSDPNQINPYLQWVIGADRSFDQELNVNLQLLGRWMQNYNDYSGVTDQTQAQVDALNAIVNNEQDPASYEISFRIADKWMNETLGAEVFGVVDLTRNDGYLRPSVNYAFTDQLKGWIGWDYYWGNNNTQFGFLQPTKGYFGELRYTF